MNRDKIIKKKFELIENNGKLKNLSLKWDNERKKRIHLVSVNSVLGKHFKWDFEKIENWAFKNFFDGMEIRVQNFFGFDSKEYSRALKFKLKGIITLHLSDWNKWIDFYLGKEGLVADFNGEENIIKYFGASDPDILTETWMSELELARKLGARKVIFHGGQIDYDKILFTKDVSSNQAVVKVLKDVLAMLLAKKYSFNICIENLSNYDLGIKRLRDFEKFLNISKRLRIVLDTSHLLSALKASHNSDNLILKELQKNYSLIKRIDIVHLSDCLHDDGRGVIKHDLDRAKDDFWYKRALIKSKLFTDHFPCGFSLIRPVDVLDYISVNKREKLIVVHEINAGSFDILEKGCIIQRLAIVSQDNLVLN